MDFTTGAHDFTKLFEIAKRVGLYVITRPGPYVNAEVNAGGFPLWLTTGAYGLLRDDDPRYLAALDPYFAEYSALTSKHLVTNGGNVLVYQIENEYGEQWKDSSKKIANPSAGRYMQYLEDLARANGIDVPLIHNDPNMNTKSWSKDFAPNATGNVDVAGLDSYPSCWSCNLDECTGTNGTTDQATCCLISMLMWVDKKANMFRSRSLITMIILSRFRLRNQASSRSSREVLTTLGEDRKVAALLTLVPTLQTCRLGFCYREPSFADNLPGSTAI